MSRDGEATGGPASEAASSVASPSASPAPSAPPPPPPAQPGAPFERGKGWWSLAASVLAALATTTGMLIAGRALMIVGAAAILPATLTIIPIEFSGKDQVTAFSAWMATTAVGQAAATAISGGLIELAVWPAIFCINLRACALAFVLVTRTTPESRDESASRSSTSRSSAAARSTAR